MNIHEHQAKEILKEFGAPVTNGVTIFEKDDLEKKLNLLTSQKLVVKAQIIDYDPYFIGVAYN